MIFRSSWVSTRIPTALLLLPVLWLTLAVSPNLNEWRSLWILVIVQFLLLGGINVYTKYYDLLRVKKYGFLMERDFSILFWTAVVFLACALILAVIKVSVLFAALILIYSAIMLTYNHPAADWKHNGVTAFIVTVFFQGIFLVVLYYTGINKSPIDQVIVSKVLLPGGIVSFCIAVVFPFVYKTKGVGGYFFERRWPLYLWVFLFVTVSTVIIWYATSLSITYVNFAFMLIVLSVLFLVKKYTTIKMNNSPTFRKRKKSYWPDWVVVISLNIILFWLFVDFTQVIQLLQL